MTRRTGTIGVLVGGLLLAATGFSAPVRADGASAELCRALATTDFTGVQDAPTRVLAARVVEAAGDVPAHCYVEGYIWPQVGFAMKLPLSGWNGKFLEHGVGGLGGVLRDWLCDDPLRRGYSCITMDSGHRGTDGLWAYHNLQAKVDYGFRAVHVAALAGKAITEHYYGAPPEFSYFVGCSGGGRQGLVEAQRFPWDFDGILAMDPAIGSTVVTFLWNAVAVTAEGDDPLFSRADIELLHDAAVARCDMDDGVRDGVIGDPSACDFDPAELVCARGRSSGCLSSEQVAAARKVYSGPTTSAGKRVALGRTMLGGEKGPFAFSSGGPFEDFFRYMGFMHDPGPTWRFRDFDFDEDYKRLGMRSLYHSTDPDLRRFQAAGGKLLIAQGWDDGGSPFPLDVVDYYETVERVMGGLATTQEFARLFMMPGRAHCGGGPGANAFDFLGYLEAWVERGAAPEMLLGAHIAPGMGPYTRFPEDSASIKFTRPVYPYPLRAVYSGAGDPNDYRNFVPVEARVQWERLR